MFSFKPQNMAKNQSKNQSGNEKLILSASAITFLYFAGILLIDLLKLDWVFLGVLREMLTIPFLIALVVLGVLSGISIYKAKNKLRSLSTYALLILLATILLLSLDS